MQLLPKIYAHSSNPNDKNSTAQHDSTAQTRIFDDNELQQHWTNAVNADEKWRIARDAVKSGERGFPPDIAREMTANIAECTVAADDLL